jgi:hypothetical protein
MPRIRPGPLALVTPGTEGIAPTQPRCTGVEVAPFALLHEWLDFRVPRGCRWGRRGIEPGLGAEAGEGSRCSTPMVWALGSRN